MASKIKNQAIAILISLIMCASIFIGVAHNFGNINASADSILNFGEFVYVSDLQHDATKSVLHTWHGLEINQNANGAKLSVKVDGAGRTFEKGIFEHGPTSGVASLVYDISAYNYNYFTAYVGIDLSNSKGQGDGVKFFVYTSVNGTDWALKSSEDPTVQKPNANAQFLSVNIKGANWLKLVVDPKCSDKLSAVGDYAVWADAKLTNAAGGNEMLAYYDERIKAKGNVGIENQDLELLVLQREFVRKAGQTVLKKFTTDSGDDNAANEAMLNWLLNDVDNLREFMLGGDPMMGNWYNSLTVLSSLYKNYKNDLNDTRLLKKSWYADWFPADRTYGQLYRIMMFAIALTHDSTVGSWMQKSNVANQSDPLRRYAIYRYMLATDRFVATRDENGIPKYDTTPWFTSLKVEEMRYVMMNIIDDESILWLNDYVQTRINAEPALAGNYHTPHRYIAYTDPNYNNPVYYAEENIDYFNELFAVDDRNNPGQKIGMWDTEYTVPGGEGQQPYVIKITRGTPTYKLQKVWMNFRNKFGTGSVCGGISKSGCNIRGVRGVPASVIGQPGHAAILAYGKNADGKGYWTIDNNVGGWTVATKSERHMLGWGNESWQRTVYGTVVYFHLAQDAVNDYDNLVKAEENVMLAKVYDGDLAKQEALYEKALTAQPINLDAWYGLAQTYISNGNKTEANRYNLAARIADKMVGYPLPMHHLLDVVKEAQTSTEYIYQHTLLEKQALTASTLQVSTNAYPGVGAAKVEAQFILGRADVAIATFAFDGENAGSIVWAETFNNTGFSWKYSVDGKQTWTSVTFEANGADERHIHKLSDAELAVISPQNDIYIHITGVPESDDNYYKIEISDKASLPATLYANDYENKVIGVNDTYEWRYVNVGDNGEVVPVHTTWTPYSAAAPDCSGDKAIEVRIKAAGEKLASDGRVFEFSANTDNEVRKYVSVEHLEVVEFSSQSLDKKRPNYAVNALDGNANTYWHTNYAESVRTSGNTPYLIIKSDTPRYFSGLEFVQYQYNSNFSIFAKDVKVYVSEDGEQWTEAGKLENIEAIDDLKVVHFNQSVYGQYVKLELENLYETKDLDGVFATVSMVNLYEDITKLEGYNPNNPNGNPNENPSEGSVNDPNQTPSNPAVGVGVGIICGVFVLAVAAVAGVFVFIKRRNASN